MIEKIIIEKPCNASWNNMATTKDGRHCSLCNTNVIDFSNMALEDIHDYFRKRDGEKICGKFHNRHLAYSNKWFAFLNKIESFFYKTKFKKVALGLIYVLLFLTGCKTKKQTMGDKRFLNQKSPSNTSMLIN